MGLITDYIWSVPSLDLTRHYRSIHLGIGISRIHVCQDFLSQACVSAAMLLTVKYWLKRVKKGMWMNFSLELIM